MPYLRRQSWSSRAGLAQVEQFLDAILGDNEGILVLARGVCGEINEKGSYRFRGGLRHRCFDWPNERQEAIGWVITHRKAEDIYVIPNLRHARTSKTEHGKSGRFVALLTDPWVNSALPPAG